MAKRNKAKFASKSRKSALRVEALEQRQLLAAVTGGGTEVGSNIVHPNGNVYDQVLMTGSTVTVTADAGQVTRVSFLDLSGDIVQAEFAGKGSLTISLDQFKSAAEAANYNQPGIKYVSGLATFTVQGEDSTTNFNVFSVGSGNAVNQNLFAGGKTGGNHVADVARLLIVADPTAPLGSTMGGIRAGNAVFADASGVVGISAANVAVQGPVIVGDIDASNAGVPTLKFGANSQFATLTVAGGDFVQTNNQTFAGNVSGFQSINSTAGTDSSGATVGSKVISATTVPGVNTVTLDVTTAFDLTGKSQADIDAAFKGRTFTSDITINGDLSGVNNLSAAEFRGAVTFTGTLSGNVSVDGAVKSLTLAKTNADNITAASIGSLTTTGTASLTGTIKAQSIGAVTVGGDLTGTITTDYYGTGATVPGQTALGTSGASDLGEKAIGAVNITGNASGTLYGVLGIGNVTVGGNVTSATDFLKTTSGSAGDQFLGSVGKVTVSGDVSQAGGDNFINIAGNGTFGDVVVSGGGTNTNPHTVGQIKVGGVLGATGTTAGNISVTDNTGTGGTLTLGQITIGSGTNNGSLGSISVTNTTGNVATTGITFNGTGSVGDVKLVASGASGSTANLGAISLSTGTAGASLGNVSVSGAKTITFGTIAATKVGNIDGAVTSTGTNAGTITTSSISASNGTTNATIGNITLNAGTINGSHVTIGGDIATSNVASNGSSSIGTVTLTAASDLTNNISINANIKASSIGAVTHNGATTFANDVGYQALKGLASFTANGDTQFNTLTNVAATFTTGTITAGAVNNDYAVNFAGTAYNASSTTIPLTFTGGGGTGAAGVATTNAAGQITAIAVTAGGTGYTAAPTLSIVGSTPAPTTAVPNIRFGGTAGPALTFNGTTRFGGSTAGFEGGQAPAILASNGSAALDNIGSLTFNGKVIGVAGKDAVRASSIGNISVVSALAQNETLVTNFSVYAGNNGVAGAGTSTSTETVARDGSNLASFSIGNITVSNTNTIGVTGTTLFGGQNSFNAIGAIGNITLTGGGSAAVQTGLGTGAFFQVGNGNVVGTGGALLNAVVLTSSGIDFDGNNIVNNVSTVTSGVFTNTDELNSVFSTNATVSIGNVTVNAAQNTADSILNLGGGTTGGTDGLVVLSGAKVAGADYTVGTNLAAASAQYRGTVGDVLLTNLNQQLSRNPAGAANDTQVASGAAGNGGLIAGVKGSGSTTPIGKVQGLAFTANPTITQDNYVIGGSATLTTDELQVIVL